AEHILCYRLRLISLIGLVTIRVSAEVWGNKAKLVSKPLNDRKELMVVLRPTMHAEDNRTTACGDIVKIDAIRFGALVHQFYSGLGRRHRTRFRRLGESGF